MAIDNVSNLAFKGYYKVTIPDVRKIQDKKEKSAVSEAAINSVVMGFNMSVDKPRVSKETSAVYYKIADSKDKDFENGFNGIVDRCNQMFNVDLSKKVYFEKVDENEFNKAEALK